MSCLLQKTRMSDVDSLITFFSLFSLKWNLSLFFSPKPNLDLPRRTFQRIYVYISTREWKIECVYVCVRAILIPSVLSFSLLFSLSRAQKWKKMKKQRWERESWEERKERKSETSGKHEKDRQEKRKKKGRKTHSSSSSSLFLLSKNSKSKAHTHSHRD